MAENTLKWVVWFDEWMTLIIINIYMEIMQGVYETYLMIVP